MAKIKHTKTELKAQRESLERFERFLPMLQLKKQQLQAEKQAIDRAVEENRRKHEQAMDAVKPWAKLFSEETDIADLLSVKEIAATENNIAGVAIPVFEDVKFDRKPVDLFVSRPWIDSGMDTIEQLFRIRTERDILEEQARLIGEELRVTSQRVNLFEKVKIPEAKENIRIIKIFLGDEQTAAVARGKIAKARQV